MTPAELRERLAGYERQELRQWQRAAWLAASLWSLFTRKRIKAWDLLPAAFPRRTRKFTKKEKMKELREIKKAVGLK